MNIHKVKSKEPNIVKGHQVKGYGVTISLESFQALERAALNTKHDVEKKKKPKISLKSPIYALVGNSNA